MKVAIAQLNNRSGKLHSNYLRMEAMVTEAVKQQADLIVFPQLSLSGMCVGDRWNQSSFRNDVLKYNEKSVALSESIDIIFGSIYCAHKMMFPAAYYAHRGQLVSTNTGLNAILKENPGFRGFDEERYFSFGTGEQWFNLNDKRIRVTLNDELEADNDADLCVTLAARPYLYDQKPVMKGTGLYVNCAGAQITANNVYVMTGGSGYYAEGKKKWGCGNYEEELVICELEDERSVSDDESLLEALTAGIREFDAQVFNSRMKWVIGLSGGLDSSCSSALLVKALGPERVIGYNMATRYNSLSTRNNARTLAEKLGITIREGSIEPLVNASEEVLKAYGYTDEYPSLVYENIQARIRGHLLSTFSSVEGGVVVNNGNKVETALGYCTMYGDSIGALSPLADLTKVQLFDLSRQINEHFGREVIPHNLLPEDDGETIRWLTPPSAELRDGQRDPMKWFYHDYLIDCILRDPDFLNRFLKSYLDNSLVNSVIYRWIRYYGLDDPQSFIEDIEWIRNSIRRNAFKRKQAPPIIAVTDYGYGDCLNEVQTSGDADEEYNELKNRILEMEGNRNV